MLGKTSSTEILEKYHVDNSSTGEVTQEELKQLQQNVEAYNDSIEELGISSSVNDIISSTDKQSVYSEELSDIQSQIDEIEASLTNTMSPQELIDADRNIKSLRSKQQEVLNLSTASNALEISNAYLQQKQDALIEEQSSAEQELQEAEANVSTILSDIPISFADGNYTVTSEYGYRVHPITGVVTFHNGIDYAIPEGTTLLSLFNGVVKEATYDSASGNYVIVESTDTAGNTFDVGYCHMSQLDVSKGQEVTAGQSLGLSGTTGNSTGPHLHLTFKINGVYYNPTYLFQ